MIAAQIGPLGLGDLLDGAFRIYRAHFVRMLLTAAIFFVPLGILSTLLLGAVVGGYTDLLGVAVNEPVYGDSIATTVASSLFFALALFVVGILNFICTMLGFLSLTVQSLSVLEGGAVTVLPSIRLGLGHLWRFLAMALIVVVLFLVLVTATYMAVLIVFFGFALLVGLLLAPAGDNPIVLIGVMGLTVLFSGAALGVIVLPLLALVARWLAAPVVLVAERLGPLAALGRSWHLTQHQTWRGILLVILLSILNFVVLGLPVALLQWLLLVALTPEVLELVSGLVAGISLVFNMLWQPFLAIALVLLYFDLRVRRESYDLELQIGTIEAELRPSTLP